MSQTLTFQGVVVGAPSVNTIDDRTVVRVTAVAKLRTVIGDGVRARWQESGIEATVVLKTGDEFASALPGERPEAPDVKALVTKAIDRAIVEARAAADAFIESLAPEPPAPTFDAATVREAYRRGFDRGNHFGGGELGDTDYGSESYRSCEAADLRGYLGEPAPAL